jgi:crotonobetainyl-CoA:carnitine CoA-transferase CaiB-like acyl-CoA transferase
MSSPATPDPAPLGPLSGIQVVDASRVLAGPYCGTLLADMGADVVRVEHPTKQDEVKSWTPIVQGTSATYAAVNHSKRGIALDLSSPGGVEVFRRMLAGADVLIENFRPGTMDDLGLSRDALRGVNPRLLHCAIRAYPTGTTNEDLPGYESSLQAYSGIMSLTGEPDRDPVRCGVSVVDIGTGMAATIAIMAALRERDRTGEGQYVEPALLRTATNLMNYQIAGYSMAGVSPQRHGSGHALLVPYRNFQCADGVALIAASNEILWAKLCTVLQLHDRADLTQFATPALRITHRAQVNDLVAAAVKDRPRHDVLQALDAAGIPCAAVNTIPDYLADPSLAPAGVLESVSIPGGEDALFAGALFGAGFLPHKRSAPPRTGEHTTGILQSLGYSTEQISALRAARAVS